MYGGALVHYLIAETYKNGRFYQQSPALQNNAVSPLLYIRDKGQYRCTSTWKGKENGVYIWYPRYLPIEEWIDILDFWY